MREKRVEGFRHVRVAQVPGRDASLEHRAVVFLRGLDQAGVLLGREELVLVVPAARQDSLSPALHLDQLVHDFPLAVGREAEGSRVSIALRVLAEVLEAGVPVAGPLGRLGVHLVEVREDGGDGAVQAVEVEPVEAGPRGRIRDAVVALAQPADEIEHVGVAPHPGGEALEVGQRLRGPGVAPRPSHEAVDAPGVGEVGLGGDAAEAQVDDEPLGQLGSPLVELVGAVRGLADEHDAGVARELEDGIEVVHRPCHRPCRLRDRADQGLV